MDPFSVIVLALIYAALRAPGEAGRAVGRDYRGRRDRWTSRAEPWMGRGRGGRRLAGYDRAGRGYNRDQRAGRRRGDPGWWRDSRAWRGREGRARVARGIRPSAIRTGIATGALAYTAVFGAGVAARGFARGLRGGYQLGKQHYRAKRNNGIDPTITVGPADPGTIPDDAEIIDAVIVDDPETTPSGTTPGTSAGPAGTGDPAAPTVVIALDPPSVEETQGPDMRTGPWLLIVHGPGINRFNGSDSEGMAVWDPADLDRRLAVIAGIPGLRAEVQPLPDIQDSQPRTAAGPTTNPGGSSVSNTSSSYTKVTGDGNQVVTNSIAGTVTNSNVQMGGAGGPQIIRDGRPASPNAGSAGHPAPSGGASIVVTGDGHAVSANGGHAAPTGRPVTGSVLFTGGGSSITAPMLMEGANYDAHLHNLNVIAKEARAEYSSAELTLASASAARQRAEHAMTAVEQMAIGLAAQDFGDTHVGNMASLHELLGRHVAQARAAEQAATESLATSEQLIEMCVSAAAVFQRDHGQLAEAHAAAPHAAKTREAYQPM